MTPSNCENVTGTWWPTLPNHHIIYLAVCNHQMTFTPDDISPFILSFIETLCDLFSFIMVYIVWIVKGIIWGIKKFKSTLLLNCNQKVKVDWLYKDMQTNKSSVHEDYTESTFTAKLTFCYKGIAQNTLYQIS